MPGRQYTGATGYRYGFNGKENDNEVKGNGNQQDYGFRIYDPRLGRFMSVDPLTKKYPELTPYQFASNSPIWMIDIDGLEGTPYNNLPYTTPENAFGEPGKDWRFAGADEAGQANNQGGFVGAYKYYNYQTANYGTLYIAQLKVSVTSCKTVEKQVTRTVTEIIPAEPPKPIVTHNSTSILPFFRNGAAKTDMNMVNLAVSLAGVRVNQAKNAGKLTSIDFVAQENNSVTQGIITGLQKTYGVKVNTTYNPNLASDYTFKANYDTTKMSAGKPEQTVTKEVTETTSEVQCETECKQ